MNHTFNCDLCLRYSDGSTCELFYWEGKKEFCCLNCLLNWVKDQLE